MSIYGYVRVSSKEQNEDRQMIAMRNVEVPEKCIYMDKQSGKDFERPMYKKMVRKLKKNDLVYIKSIDRLGRNYQDEMPLLDTRRGKDLVGTFLSDIVLQVLSFVAENERTNIKSRQREGIEAAKARGVVFGRPVKELPDNFSRIYKKWRAGDIKAHEAAALCSVSRSTFYSRVRDYERELNGSDQRTG